MKFLFLLALSLFTVSAQATYFPNNCVMTVAGRCLNKTEVDRLETNTITAGNGFMGIASATTAFSPIRIGDQTTIQAPASTNIVCLGMRLTSSSTSGVGAQLVYSDDVATVNDATLTNPVYQAGAASSFTAQMWNVDIGKPALHEVWWGFSGFKVPSSKYLSVQIATGTGGVEVFCNLYAN